MKYLTIKLNSFAHDLISFHPVRFFFVFVFVNTQLLFLQMEEIHGDAYDVPESLLQMQCGWKIKVVGVVRGQIGCQIHISHQHMATHGKQMNG